MTAPARRPSNTRARVLFYCRAGLHTRCSGRLHSTDTGQDYRCTCYCHQDPA